MKKNAVEHSDVIEVSNYYERNYLGETKSWVLLQSLNNENFKSVCMAVWCVYVLVWRRVSCQRSAHSKAMFSENKTQQSHEHAWLSWKENNVNSVTYFITMAAAHLPTVKSWSTWTHHKCLLRTQHPVADFFNQMYKTEKTVSFFPEMQEEKLTSLFWSQELRAGKRDTLPFQNLVCLQLQVAWRIQT